MQNAPSGLLTEKVASLQEKPYNRHRNTDEGRLVMDSVDVTGQREGKYEEAERIGRKYPELAVEEE